MKLYDYQQDAATAALRSLRRKRNPLVVAPTGTGKTVVSSEIIRRYCGKKRRALVVAGRDVLLGQHADTLARMGLCADIEQAGRRASARAQVVIASAQTIARDARAFDPDAFSLVVFDEAHHSAAPTWMRIARHYRCPRAGFTATPDRLDGKALGDVFDEVAYEMDMITAIERGLIVPVIQRTVTVEAIDISRIRTVHGDLEPGALGRLLSKVEALQGVAVPLLDHVGDRRTLAFAVTVEHACALAEQMNKIRAGVARATWGDDPQRAEALAEFRAGGVQVLVNVDLYREGFDDPAVSCIAMARPTASRLLYAQAIGRGTRLHDGKSDCLVMDFVGNSGRHELVTSFDLLERKDEKAEVRRAAAEIGAREPDVAAHVALERARVLPGAVLERYRVVDAARSRRRCVACDGPVPPVLRGNPRKTCSKACWRKHINAMWSMRKKDAERLCAMEGCTTVVSGKSMYCSCAHAGLARRKPVEPKRCVVCEGPMLPPNDSKARYSFATKKTCSRACHGALVGQTRVKAEPEAKPCEACGMAFRRRDGEEKCEYTKRRACSSACRYVLAAAANRKG